MATPQLITLLAACEQFSIPLRTGRRLVRTGKLPATKPGKEYLVRVEDLAALLAPQLRAPAPMLGRESPNAKALRQLAAAGLAVNAR